MKIYAVKKGRTTGLFYSWEEVLESTKGYPNAMYKSFTTINQAVEYLKDTTEEKPLDLKDTWYAYVDGSNKGDGSYYSGSAVIVQDNEVIDTVSMKGNNEEFLKKRNIAGEIMGALLAISWALNHELKELIIAHDYVGVGKWATGEFTARDPLAKLYKQQVDNCKSLGLTLHFVKVLGHSGVEFNELADQLAKKELGI